MSKVQLKMVAGRSYASPAFREGTIHKGDTVTVDESAAKALLDDGFYDPSNNFHRYFKAVGEVVQPEADGDPNPDLDGGDQKDTETPDGEDQEKGQEEDPDEGGPNEKKSAPAAKRVARTAR